MKKLILISALVLSACASHQEQDIKERVMKTDNIIVHYSEESKADVISAAKADDIRVVHDLKTMNVLVFGVAEKDVDKEIHRMEKVKGVLGVQKDSNTETLQ